MILMVLAWSSLQVSSPPVPTLGSLEELSPAAVGNLVLSGQEHGVIEAVEVRDPIGADPPGFVYIELVEQASRQPNGCVRQRWRTTFRQPTLDSPKAASTLWSTYVGTEVSRLSEHGCAGPKFTRISSNMTTDKALLELDRLSDIRSGKEKVQYTCTDSTPSGLFERPDEIPQELEKLSPGYVNHENGRTLIWSWDERNVLTEVAFPDGDPNVVMIRRVIPAPF